MMLGVMNQTGQFMRWFGVFISQSCNELDITPTGPPCQPDEIWEAWKRGVALTRLGGLRVLTLGNAVFVNGERVACSHPEVLAALARSQVLTLEDFGDALDDPSLLAQLAALVNSGYWFFGE